jgi:hypothetical protein
MNTDIIGFWHWLAKGSGSKPGYRRLIDWWLLFHLIIGIIMALIVRVELAAAASTVFLPLVGILVGLSFAWAGNAQALLQTQEIEDLSERHEGGFTEYVFVFQLAIFIILLTLVLWGLAGLRVFDDLWPTGDQKKSYLTVKSFLFVMSSITLRECWHVVLGAQWMLLIRREIQRTRRRGNSNK